ncbi:TPA: hypothetical protein ACOEHI_003848 [Enterobacter kobei]
MLSNLRLADAITIRNRMDLNTYRIGDQLFNRLMTDGKQDLLFESWSIADFEALYFYDTDFDRAGGLLLEAITTTRAKISQTMRAFIRSLNQSLEGTGIIAGVTNVEDAAEGASVIGGAEIGKARRSGNLALLPAQIPLSDGQTVTIVFHSPTGDTTKITSSDTLVAFRFFLNKRDVTHTVAPIGGRDMSLKQTTQILSNLIERNSEKFQRSRDKNARLQSEIIELEAHATEQDGQISKLVTEGDELIAAGSTLDADYEKFRKLADKQASINALLQTEIDKMKALLPNRITGTNIPTPGTVKPEIEDSTRQVTQNLQMNGQHTLSNGAVIQMNSADKNGELIGWVTITTPDGTVYKIDSPSTQGGAMQNTAKKLLKLYRDGNADKYKANDLGLNDKAKSLVDAALAIINNINGLTIESGADAVEDASKQLLQQRHVLQSANVIEHYLDQLEKADSHLAELKNVLSNDAKPGSPETNAGVASALEVIQSAAALTDASLEEIKAHIKLLREAYAVLESAGVLEQYQALFDAASQHLGDLMQQIARG